MVIGFNPQFKDLILQGTKIHTIREDKTDRWKPGMKMHMATGVRTKKYNQFADKTCTGTQKIQFVWKIFNKGMANENWGVRIFIDDVDITNDPVINKLLDADGFKTRNDFFNWPAWNKKNFTGKIIHWTDKKY